ncbi:MAG: hypothetical protein VW443_00490 [Pseudomonadales bacterium]
MDKEIEKPSPKKEKPVDRNKLRDSLVSKVKKKVAAEVVEKSTKKKPGEVYYISKEDEPSQFSIQVAGEKYKGYWDSERRRLCWRIPESLASRFEQHHHFLMGRIIKADEV